MGLFGILTAVVVLFALAYVGIPVIILSIICTIIVALSNEMGVGTTLTEIFLPGAANSFQLIFIVGIFGAVIAEFYKASGGATAIARSLLNASKKIFKGSNSVVVPIVVINVIGMILCYGGINGVIAIIIMMPIVLEIMKSYDMPRYLAAGIIMGATCTAAMTMPGSPQSQNVIPGLYLGTSPVAGLIAGIIAGIIVVVLNIAIMTVLTKKAMKKGDHYEEYHQNATQGQETQDHLPNVWIALIPMVATFVLYVVVRVDIMVALGAGLILCFPCFWKQLRTFHNFCRVLTDGSMNSCGLLMVVCMLSGFGAVVAETDSFHTLCSYLTKIPGPATFKVLIAMAITVMVAGSGPAGEMAGVPMFSQVFGEMGVSAAAFHRIAAFTGTCLDTLPSNAGVNIASQLSGYSVKETYKYCFLTSVLTTSVGAIVVTILLTLFPNLP
jgi:H+/gluconate symporter-like permease